MQVFDRQLICKCLFTSQHNIELSMFLHQFHKMVCIAIAPTSCFVICLSLHFIARSGSIPQSQTDLQTSTNGHFVRRELDLNVTPTASMEEEHSKVAVALTQSKNKDVEVQSNHMPRQAKEKGVVSSKGRKLSEEDKRKKKYENNRLCVQRYRFKYSKEGQKIAAETLGPIEKAEYDRKFNQLREKRKGYKAKYYQNVKIGVEKNDPKAIARNVMIQDSNRKASRKYMRRVRAQKTLNGKKQPVEATPDAIQPFVRRMDPKEPGTTPDSSEKNGKRVSQTISCFFFARLTFLPNSTRKERKSNKSRETQLQRSTDKSSAKTDKNRPNYSIQKQKQSIMNSLLDILLENRIRKDDIMKECVHWLFKANQSQSKSLQIISKNII